MEVPDRYGTAILEHSVGYNLSSEQREKWENTSRVRNTGMEKKTVSLCIAPYLGVVSRYAHNRKKGGGAGARLFRGRLRTLLIIVTLSSRRMLYSYLLQRFLAACLHAYASTCF